MKVKTRVYNDYSFLKDNFCYYFLLKGVLCTPFFVY